MEDFTYSIRRSDRARRVRFTVDAGRGIEVVLPSRVPEREAAAAIRELRPWIERRVGELERARATVAARGDRVPYLDELLEVRGEAGRTRVHRRGDELLAPAGAQRLAALERWSKRAARQEIGPRTRWASCSPEGAMSFNWRLLLAPEAVLDYVVWHEVCHLEVMDHSRRFWRLLASRCPDYRRRAAWLRHHGATLVLPAG